MAICQVCAKTKQYGRNVSHSHRVTKRVFKPNVVSKRIYVNGTITKAMVCGKCIKRVKKYGKMTAKADAKLKKGIITFVDWKKLAEKRISTEQVDTRETKKTEKPTPVKSSPDAPKAKEISIEELVGKKS